MNDNEKYKLIVNDRHEYELTAEDLTELDVQSVGEKQYHIIKDQVSYNLNIKSFDLENKYLVININGKDFAINIEDKYDQLVNKLGLSAATAQAEKAIKAPMPGLVLEVKAKVGDVVEAGAALLILEAMKMENVIKSTGPATISAIHIKKGNTVEKGQLLIELENKD